MDETETPKPKLYGTNYGEISDEDYQAVKERYPNIKFNDEDKTFISSKGNWCSAAILKDMRPIQKGDKVITAMGGKAKAESGQLRYERYLANLRKGMRITAAARLAGLEYTTLHARRKADPAFREKELQAEMQAAEPVETALFQAAVAGNVPAAIKWLEKRAPERWPSDKTIIETKATLELDASDHMQNILTLLNRLQEREEIIDIEVIEPNQLNPAPHQDE